MILPRSIPLDGQLPTPNTFTTPSGNTSPTTATTFDVPTSNPTIVLASTPLTIFAPSFYLSAIPTAAPAAYRKST